MIGIVAVAGNTLRIITVDNLGALFNQVVFPLRYTPRKMCRIGATDLVYTSINNSVHTYIIELYQ